MRLLESVSHDVCNLLLSCVAFISASVAKPRREIVQFPGTSGGPYFYLISELHASRSNGNGRFFRSDNEIFIRNGCDWSKNYEWGILLTLSLSLRLSLCVLQKSDFK